MQQHPLVQPPIQQKRQHQHRSQIPHASRQTLPEREQTQGNLQRQYHQDQRQLDE